MRDGVDWLLCTATSEAFGLMVHNNCCDKWQASMKLKAENKGKYKIVLCKFSFDPCTYQVFFVNYRNQNSTFRTPCSKV